HPAATNRLRLEINRVPLGPSRVRSRQAILGELLLVAPLTAMGIVPGRRLHDARWLGPVQSHRNGVPRSNRRQLLLADIVVDAAAVDAAAAAQDQGDRRRPVAEV